MKIISSSSYKKDNKHLLMKEEQIKLTLSKLFHGQKIKWHQIENSKYTTLINITKVILSKNYSSAKIFVNLYSFALEDKYNIKLIVKELNKEVPIIRKFLGQELSLRRIPDLSFKVDDKFPKVQRVEELLDSLKLSDKI